MAAVVYPKYMEALIQGSSNTSLAGTVKAALVDTGTYTYSDTHDFYDDLSGVVGTPVALSNMTYTNGVLNADDSTWTSVSGSSAESVVLYIDTGSSATSRLVAYIDGVSVTPNGNNITAGWDVLGIVDFAG